MGTVEPSRDPSDADGAVRPRAPGDPLDLLLQHLRELVGVDAAMVLTVDERRTRIEPLAAWFSSPRLEAAMAGGMARPYDRERPLLTEAAIERGGPLLLPRLEDWEAAVDAHAALDAVAGPGAWELVRGASAIACPVRTPLGRTLGALVAISIDSRHPLDRADVAVVRVLADLAALARERSDLLATALVDARALAQERQLARALEHGFVPAALPEVPGWDVGLLYEPAGDQPTGGDLYGAWPVGDDELAILIGDVAGKGAETASLSAMARFFVEARSWDCADPARVLEQVSAMLRGRLPQDRFVTAFLGFVGRRRLRYASAGHLPPLVLHSGGAIAATAAGGVPLGVDGGGGYVERELELGPDDILLAFTDGLVEARRDGRLLGDDGLRGIVREAVAATRDPQALTELIHAEARAWARGLDDDAAIVALRRRGPAPVADVTRAATAP